MCAPSPSIGMNQSKRGAGLGSTTRTLPDLHGVGQHPEAAAGRGGGRRGAGGGKEKRVCGGGGGGGPPPRPPLPVRIVRARPRLFISIAVGVVVTAAAAGLTDWRPATRLIAGWDLAVALYLVF